MFFFLKRRISDPGFTEFSFSRASNLLILRSRLSRCRRKERDRARQSKRDGGSSLGPYTRLYDAIVVPTPRYFLFLSSPLKSDRPRASTRPSLLYVIAVEGMGTGLRGHRIPTSVFPPRCAITHHRGTRRTELSSSCSLSISISLFLSTFLLSFFHLAQRARSPGGLRL